jgi:hypothetical protein
VADRSLRTIAIVTLSLVAPVFALPRVAAAESAFAGGVAPIFGWAVFDFGRTDRLRAKLVQAERRQAAAEARAHAAEASVKLEHAASEAEHAAYVREHAAYERERAAYEHEHMAYVQELATLAAYRKQSDVQRDRLARLNAQNARASRLAQTAPRTTACSLVAAVPLPPRHVSTVVHHATKPNTAHPRIVAVPHSLAKEPPHPAAVTRNRSVGWGAI